MITKKIIVSYTIVMAFAINSIAFSSDAISALAQVEQNTVTESDTNTIQQASNQNNNTVVLTANEIDSTFLWVSDDGVFNPTLQLPSDTDTTIIIKSQPDNTVEHELIIATWNGTTLAESEEISSGSTSQISFNPGQQYASLKYYCEYHPDTMRGTIQVK